MFKCAMSDRICKEFDDGLWDDGEWISWDWINSELEANELRAEFPGAPLELITAFSHLVDAAKHYRSVTGRYLQIWGELGELFAELRYGIRRHRPHAQGSDGKIGDDYVEIKTISPEKSGDAVHVKMAGNFTRLVVVKISRDLSFDARMIDRRALKKHGHHAEVRWSQMPKQISPKAAERPSGAH